MDQTFKKVPEATYLATEKSDKYRAILRFFFIQHERLREFLLPEEIFAYLQQSRHFTEYDMEELHADLAALVKWGNLNAHQESGKVKTIEEFKKKRFRYQVTPYTVEFERMLIKFENDTETFRGSLEKTQFERLNQKLLDIRSFSGTDEAAAQLWDDLLTYFKKIVENTSDYFAYLRSEEASEQMKSEAFFLYKDKFTRYLREFVIHLQRTAASIQEVILQFTSNELESFLYQVASREGSIFRFEEGISEEARVEELREIWGNMKNWFIRSGSSASQYEQVLEQTNEAIHRITRMIQRMGERSQLKRSRQADYLHLAAWFLNLEDMEEAHELSSVVFGLTHTRHIFTDHIPTDNMYTDTWEEEPMDHERLPRIRTYRERTRAQPTERHSEDKARAKEAYLLNQKYEQEVLYSYMQGNTIELEVLDHIEPFVRKIFLNWIGRSMLKKDKVITTSYGDRIQVRVDADKRIKVQSVDGELEMPAVTFYFLDRRAADAGAEV